MLELNSADIPEATLLAWHAVDLMTEPFVMPLKRTPFGG